MSLNHDASKLQWSDIRQHWFYDDLSLGGYRSPQVIPVKMKMISYQVLFLIHVGYLIPDVRRVDGGIRRGCSNPAHMDGRESARVMGDENPRSLSGRHFAPASRTFPSNPI